MWGAPGGPIDDLNMLGAPGGPIGDSRSLAGFGNGAAAAAALGRPLASGNTPRPFNVEEGEEGEEGEGVRGGGSRRQVRKRKLRATRRKSKQS